MKHSLLGTGLGRDSARWIAKFHGTGETATMLSYATPLLIAIKGLGPLRRAERSDANQAKGARRAAQKGKGGPGRCPVTNRTAPAGTVPS